MEFWLLRRVFKRCTVENLNKLKNLLMKCSFNYQIIIILWKYVKLTKSLVYLLEITFNFKNDPCNPFLFFINFAK